MHPRSNGAPSNVALARFDLVPFVRSAGVLSLSALANFVRAVVTAKVLAVTLGPTPVGVLSQLLNFSSLLMTIVPLGLTTGVSKLTADTRLSEKGMDRVVGSAVAISSISGTAMAVLVLPFTSRISLLLTGSSSYSSLVALTLLTLPLYNVAGVLGYVLQGLSDIPRLTRANVATALITVVLVVPAAIRFGLLGVVLAIVVASLAQLVVFLMALVSVYRSRNWSLWELIWSPGTARSLLGYGVFLLVGGVALWGSTLVVRTVAVHQIGQYGNGIYQVAYGVSTQYITIFMTWMGAYVFPRLVIERNHERLAGLLNSGLRANLLIMGPILLLVVALRQPAIHVLYSSAFISAASLIPIQALGDYVRVVAWSFGIALFAQDHVKAHLVGILIQSASWVVATLVMLPRFGISALVLGYGASYLVYLVVIWLMVRYWFDVRVKGQSLVMTVLGFAFLLAAAHLPWFVGVILALAIPATAVVQQRGLMWRPFQRRPPSER